HGRYNGEDIYVHSSFVSTTRPANNPPPPPPVNNSNNNSSSAGNTQPVSTAPPVQGATCPSMSATCSQLTCDQAYACLRAGNRGLDRDSDGVPCESICPGG